MLDQVNYVTNEQGEQVGVLLDIATYQQLILDVSDDPDQLLGLSVAELEALAESKLAPAEQARMDELLARNAQTRLSEAEILELDNLLAQVDQLTMLKARAQYTLKKNSTLISEPQTSVWV